MNSFNIKIILYLAVATSSYYLATAYFSFLSDLDRQSGVISYVRADHARNANFELTEASITQYGWTGYPMANGEYPYLGACASSDRTIPLGTVVEIDGTKYIVKDRTALWVHEKHGLTLDIYSQGTKQEMLNYGRKHLIVKIYGKTN